MVSGPSVNPAYALNNEQDDQYQLELSGDWLIVSDCPSVEEIIAAINSVKMRSLIVDCSGLGQWDSSAAVLIWRLEDHCTQEDIQFDTDSVPGGLQTLRKLAAAVPQHVRPQKDKASLLNRLNPLARLTVLWDNIEESLAFLGEATLAMGRMLTGKANTRTTDVINFIYQAGPKAFGIITLTSFLVGMILAYLGAAQLAQFGAQVYVADLVTVGMLREMGALMTAVVMAGRTGAAYAAQLGTMQTNEEIDAIVTLGISPMEFLVLPRMLALIIIMPLLVLYSNVIGIAGGSLVAAGMGVSFIQFGVQFESVFTPTLLALGLIKSVAFAVLIAIAGCRAGMQCGRSSAAVGEAATKAVVTAIVYLIVADAAFNILFQQMGI